MDSLPLKGSGSKQAPGKISTYGTVKSPSSLLKKRRQRGNEKLTNFVEDHKLKAITLFNDESKENLAARYNATGYPASFLVSKEEMI